MYSEAFLSCMVFFYNMSIPYNEANKLLIIPKHALEGETKYRFGKLKYIRVRVWREKCLLFGKNGTKNIKTIFSHTHIT